MNNLELWEAVCKTDPKYTKGFSRAGGFSGTAINATYLIRKATEKWGPIGGAWGYTIEESFFQPGAPGDVIHIVRIRFRHPGGEFPAFGQTTFVGKNKNGAFTDEEAPKKSLTDAITKALSMLGFSADVHMGLFDDSKYVNDRRAEEKRRTSSNAAATAEVSEESKQRVQELLGKVVDWLAAESPDDAYLELENAGLDSDEKTYLWNFLDSKQRSAIKKAGEAMRKANEAAFSNSLNA